MLIIELKRFIYTKQETIGVLSINGENFFTLEDTVRNEKIFGKTAIPNGEYPLKLTESPKFGKYFHYKNGILIPSTKSGETHFLILIDKIPNYSRVLIHWGNTNVDTNGCILVGTDVVKLENSYMIKRSKEAYMKLYPLLYKMIENQEVKIKITNL